MTIEHPSARTMILSVIQRTLPRTLDPEDLASDIWLELWEGDHTVQISSRIVKLRCFSRLSRSTALREKNRGLLFTIPQSVQPPEPSTDLLDKLMEEAKLSAVELQYLWSTWFRGQTFASTAQTYQTSEYAIQRAVSSAIEKLKAAALVLGKDL